MHWQRSVVSKQDTEEEEVLTEYEAKESALAEQQTNISGNQQLQDPRLAGWEFKIVRANRNLFREPATLQQLCKEEAEAGWIMLEKLDDRRVRFKRPISMRDVIKAEFLENDPYRCHYSSSWQPLPWLGAIAFLVAMVLPAYLGYTFVSHQLASHPAQSLPADFPPLKQPLSR